MLEFVGFDPVALALGAAPVLWVGMLIAATGMVWVMFILRLLWLGEANPRAADSPMIIGLAGVVAGVGLLLHGPFGYSQDARVLREALESPNADVWVDEDKVRILIPARKDTVAALGRMVEERIGEATLVFPRSRLGPIEEALRAEGSPPLVPFMNERR